MDAYVGVASTRAGRVVAAKGCLVGALIQIGIFVLLISVNCFCDLSCFGFALVCNFRSRGRARGYDFSYAVQASCTSGTVQKGRGVRVIGRRFVAMYFDRVFDFSGSVAWAETVQGGSFRFFLLLFRIFVRRLIM